LTEFSTGLKRKKTAAFAVFVDFVDGKDFAVEAEEDARGQEAGSEQGFSEILEGVRALNAEGCHGPGADDRNCMGRGLQSLGDNFARLNDRVCAVRDEYWDALCHADEDTVCNESAVFIRHEEGVFVHELFYGDLRGWKAQKGQAAADLRMGVFHGARVLHVTLFDGAAGGDQVDSVHGFHDGMRRTCGRQMQWRQKSGAAFGCPAFLSVFVLLATG
jgi:hypothetical protein